MAHESSSSLPPSRIVFEVPNFMALGVTNSPLGTIQRPGTSSSSAYASVRILVPSSPQLLARSRLLETSWTELITLFALLRVQRSIMRKTLRLLRWLSYVQGTREQG